MKFDVIIGNPPYSRTLHNKILNKIAKSCKGEIIFVHPSAWLIKNTKRNKDEQESFDLINTYETKYVFIKGKYYFRSTFSYQPLLITHMNMREVRNESSPIKIYNQLLDIHWSFANIDDINMHSDSTDYLDLKKHIKSISGCKLSDYIATTTTPNQYYVMIRKLFGSEPDPMKANQKKGITIHRDFTALVTKQAKVCEVVKDGKMHVAFSTKLEADNFLDYIKTDFVRICLLNNKYNQNSLSNTCKDIPYMDFTKEWSNDDLYKHFDIKPQWRDVITDLIEPYYDQSNKDSPKL